jgi:hypothetical protein
MMRELKLVATHITETTDLGSGVNPFTKQRAQFSMPTYAMLEEERSAAKAVLSAHAAKDMGSDVYVVQLSDGAKVEIEIGGVEDMRPLMKQEWWCLKLPPPVTPQVAKFVYELVAAGEFLMDYLLIETAGAHSSAVKDRMQGYLDMHDPYHCMLVSSPEELLPMLEDSPY